MGLVFVVEFLSQFDHLTTLEGRDPDRAPAFSGTRHGGEHKLVEKIGECNPPFADEDDDITRVSTETVDEAAARA